MINTYSLKGGEQVDKLQEIFNNREIAVGIWLFLFISISIFTKPGKYSLKSVLPILFCRKFVIFYMIFLSYFYLVIVFLQYIGFWSYALLKDTIFWILFVELPLFVKAIEKATDNHFFAKLIKDNMTIVVIFQFFIGFWTFDLLTEILLVPISILIGCIYFWTTRKRKYMRIKKYIERLFFFWNCNCYEFLWTFISKTIRFFEFQHFTRITFTFYIASIQLASSLWISIM